MTTATLERAPKGGKEMRWFKGWFDELCYEIGWTYDHSAAYLISADRFLCRKLVGRWIRNRPELCTFNPARWRLGQAISAEGGTLYGAVPMRRGMYGRSDF